MATILDGLRHIVEKDGRYMVEDIASWVGISEGSVYAFFSGEEVKT